MDNHLHDNAATERGVKEDWAMRELSRTFGFILWITLGGVTAGIFHAYLTLDGWSLPLALVLLLIVAFTIAGLRSLMRHMNEMRLERIYSGRCPRCGYDLRINPGRCPECGTPTVARTGRARAM